MPVATLYATHLPYVRGVVRTLGVAEADVDDVAQEVFCVLLRRPLPQAESRGVRRWLYQTARRVVSNHRRGRRREERRLEHAWSPVAAPCPETEAMQRQARGRLDGAVAALSPDARALYRMSEVEEVPGPVIAQRLGLNPNTAYARVRALRRRLVQSLLLLMLLLAALLISQAGCATTPPSSATITRASSDEVPDDRRGVALRGPALGLIAPAGPR